MHSEQPPDLPESIPFEHIPFLNGSFPALGLPIGIYNPLPALPMASITDIATPAAAALESVSAPAPRGALVVLEGLDRSGKTTQVKLLQQRFVELGKKVRLMRFPGEHVKQFPSKTS